jgi:hypothetical protein
VAILAAAALLSGCGSSTSKSDTGGSSPGASAACGTPQARTLAASTTARVFLAGEIVSGCAAGGSTSYVLGRQGAGCLGAGRVQALAVAGDLAAYGLERCGVDTGRTMVTVRRLTDGKVLASRPAITNAVAVESYQSVSSLVLKPDGAVAWVAVLGSVLGHRHATEVHKLDGHGEVLLDSGASLAPGPLTLAGATVHWKHGTGSRSATLQ